MGDIDATPQIGAFFNYAVSRQIYLTPSLAAAMAMTTTAW